MNTTPAVRGNTTPAIPPAMPVQPGIARVAMGAPVPSGPERVVWQGRASLAYWFPGLLWSLAWCLLWLYAYQNAAQLLRFVLEIQPDLSRELNDLPLAPLDFRYAFVALAALSGLRIISRILRYLNNYYQFSSQRVLIREGVLSRTFNQIELFRLKDFSVHQSCWGMIAGYGHIRLVSSERLKRDVVLRGIPWAPGLINTMRGYAQESRAESGMVNISE